MTSFFAELKRRNVFRVALVYAVGGWLLLQVADVLFGVLELPGWSLRLVFGILILGFPAALVFAWIYELTPEGLRRERDIPESESITAHTARKLNVATVVLLAVAVALLVGDRLLSGSSEVAGPEAPPAAAAPEPAPAAEPAPEEARDLSIAVLPFADMSAAGDQEYFSDGIAEELLNALVRVDGLRVASRTSAFSLKGQALDVPSIGERLNVSYILEGSVRTAGERMRVTAQLIEVETDSHLWSETYDRRLDDIFAIQDEITGKVVDELKVRLAPGEAPSAHVAAGTEDPEAYRRYLQGRHLWRQRSPASLRAAISAFEESVAIDPGFARAWSNAAVAYTNLPSYDLSADRAAYLARARAAADRALEIDPGLSEAWTVKADLTRAGCRQSEAAGLFLRAIEADEKDPTARHWYALLLQAVGQENEAMRQIDAAYAIDPLIGAVSGVQGDLALSTGDYPMAEKAFARARALGIYGGSTYDLGRTRIFVGDLEGARALMESRYGNEPGFEKRMDLLFAALKDPGAVPAYETYVRENMPDSVYVLRDVAEELLILGSSVFFEIAERIDCDQPPVLLWTDRAADVRRDPRFEAFARRTGMLEYWRVHGWPDDCESLNPDFAECG